MRKLQSIHLKLILHDDSINSTNISLSGKNGWENIIELDLNDTEKELFSNSANAVRNMNSALA